MSEKIGIIGQPSPSGSIAHMLGGMSDRSREAMRNELTTRRTLVNRMVETLMGINHFDVYRKLSNKELKKKSKEFMLVCRYVEPLQLHLYTAGTKVPSMTEVKRIAAIVNSLCNSKQFAKMDLEDVTTDFFEIVLATYIACKLIIESFKKRRPDQTAAIHMMTMVASDVGLRLYDLYIDNRLSDVNDGYEEVDPVARK